MEAMATPEMDRIAPLKSDEDAGTDPLSEVRELMSSEKFSEAFFVARRLAAEGTPGAIEITEEIRGKMDD